MISSASLLYRLLVCDRRWEAAMSRPGYLDEPPPDRSFTEEEWQMYLWADGWRDAFHNYEQMLFRHPDVRAGMLEGLTSREPLTIYES